jgi:hypothetical protein
MRKKYLQLIEHNSSPFTWYGIHEAVMDGDNICYIIEKAVEKFDDYHVAIKSWARQEQLSAYVDVLTEEEARGYYNKQEYTDVEELNFDD